MLFFRLMEEASLKYLVGQVISAISYPLSVIWAMISLSKTKLSEHLLKLTLRKTLPE